MTVDGNPTIVEPKDEDYSLDVTLKPEHQLAVNSNKTQFKPVSELRATPTNIGTSDKTRVYPIGQNQFQFTFIMEIYCS